MPQEIALDMGFISVHDVAESIVTRALKIQPLAG